MKTKTLWGASWLSLPVLMLACGGQAVDVGSNEGGDSGAGGASGATPGSGANPGTGAVAATGTGASAAMGAGASAGTGSGPDTSGVGAYGNVNGPEPVNCDSSTYPPGTPPAAWPDPASCEPGSSSLQGTWTGYVQGIDSGAYPNEGNFRLTLQGDDSALCGSVIFGEPIELPPVTDPEAGYLVDGMSFKSAHMLEGFAYTVLDVEVSGERGTFALSLAEPYGAWCELQTPHYDAQNGTGWNCTRNLGTRYHDNGCFQEDPCSATELEVSCPQHELCSGFSSPCACDSQRCAADVAQEGPRFDVRFDESEAEGELNGSLIFLQRE